MIPAVEAPFGRTAAQRRSDAFVASSSDDEEAAKILGLASRRDNNSVRIDKPSQSRSSTHEPRKLSTFGTRPQNSLTRGLSAPHTRAPQQRTTKVANGSHVRVPHISSGALTAVSVSVPSATRPDRKNPEPHPPKRRKTTSSGQFMSESNESSLDEEAPGTVTFGARFSPDKEQECEMIGTRRVSNRPLGGRIREYQSVQRMMDPKSKKIDDRQKEGSRSPLSSLDQFLDEKQKRLEIPNRQRSSVDWSRDELGNGEAERTSPFFGTKHKSNGSPSKPAQHSGFLSSADNSQSLVSRFRSIDGRSRGSTVNHDLDDSSPDELTQPATNGRRADVIELSPEKLSRRTSPKRSESPVKLPGKRVEPSNIVPTNFQSGKMTRKRTRLKEDSDSDGEEQSVWSAPVAAINIPGKPEIWRVSGVGLVRDTLRDEFVFKQKGSRLYLGSYRDSIQLKKLQRVVWEQGGCRIRVEHSNDNNISDNVLEMQLQSEKAAAALATILQGRSSVCRSESSDRMDKIFANSRNQRQISNIGHKTRDPVPQDVSHIANKHSKREERASYTSSRNASKSGIVSKLMDRAKDFEVKVHQENPFENSKRLRPEPRVTSNSFKYLEDQPNSSHLRRSTRKSGIQESQTLSIWDAALPEDYERYSQTTGLGPRWTKSLSYPREAKKKVTVEFDDLERLDEGQFLNDNLISFYLRYLEHKLETNRPDVASKVYFFNSFFYERLKSLQVGQKLINFEAVKKWTRNVDLFTYDYVIVPINEQSHWYAAIICNLPALSKRLAPSEEPEEQREIAVVDSKEEAEELEAKPSPVDTCKPREQETTESFAEMSLDGDNDQKQADEPSAPGLTEQEYGIDTGQKTPGDDKEMLDVPEPNSDALLDPALPRRGLSINEIQQDPIEDPDEVTEAQPIKKNKKRKSAPIMNRDPDLPAIITFDSLDHPHSAVARSLRQYLVEEGKDKRGGMKFDESQIRGITAKDIPLQNNFSDCGLYVLGYIEKFLSESPRDFISKIIKREYDVKRDWPQMIPKQMRENMRKQLQELHEEQDTYRKSMAIPKTKNLPGSGSGETSGRKVLANGRVSAAPKTSTSNEDVVQETSTKISVDATTSVEVLTREITSQPQAKEEQEPEYTSPPTPKPTPNQDGPLPEESSLIILDSMPAQQTSEVRASEAKPIAVGAAAAAAAQEDEPPSSQPPTASSPPPPSPLKTAISPTLPFEIPESQSQQQRSVSPTKQQPQPRLPFPRLTRQSERTNPSSGHNEVPQVNMANKGKRRRTSRTFGGGNHTSEDTVVID